jgi:hypothetical protein
VVKPKIGERKQKEDENEEDMLLRKGKKSKELRIADSQLWIQKRIERL